ncbi:plasmodesmata-located protein 8-like [Impatiens glandulifera]|uniref:plasmodesmata-located protein 8-like n=1 Tax=Impatiens glandulifera TaxID=253017 RepID=UPI001FB193CC|nr:plasmodesmata-located protein 8-like [Impatiens glandulifera]
MSTPSQSLFFMFFFHIIHIKAIYNDFIYATCTSQETYQPNSPYESTLHNLLTSMAISSSRSLYGSFSIANDNSSEASMYGLYQCRGDLNLRECLKCVESVADQVQLACPHMYGASLQLEECFIRYERSDFLGKLDTGIRYKKCSEIVSEDAEFLKRRDDVLTDLMVATSFKISTSGLVEGFAQCLGDVSVTDCSACLANAVQKLKTICGPAEAVDVYLAQCYAKYWASGYYRLPIGTHVKFCLFLHVSSLFILNCVFEHV